MGLVEGGVGVQAGNSLSLVGIGTPIYENEFFLFLKKKNYNRQFKLILLRKRIIYYKIKENR